MDEKKLVMPMVALRGMTILPHMVRQFEVSRKASIEAVQEAMAGEQKVFLVTQKEVEKEHPKQKDLCMTGTIAAVNQIVKLPNLIYRVLVSGERRAMLYSIKENVS